MGYKRLTKQDYDDEEELPDWLDIFERLRKLENKIEQGKLIELPCKVGDTVYWVSMDYDDDGVLYHYIDENPFSVSDMSYWGVWVFPTIEEAEAKLKEIQNG